MWNNNSNFHKARQAKNDEFYTKLSDIEEELKYYKHHFKGKKVYLNCDDYKYSQFYSYFKSNFKELQLKELNSTHYKEGELVVWVSYNGWYENTSFLKGNGDFRSEESIELLKQCDIVVTNPPFSLWKEYFAQLMKYNKKFLILGNLNSVFYKNIFPYIRDNKIWIGVNRVLSFKIPNGEKRVNALWYTNLESSYKMGYIDLYKKYNVEDNPKYDNYDAINTDLYKKIPYDYNGLIGVPISLMIHYNKDQFELVHNLIPFINGKKKYCRLIIRHKKKYDEYGTMIDV